MFMCSKRYVDKRFGVCIVHDVPSTLCKLYCGDLDVLAMA